MRRDPGVAGPHAGAHAVRLALVPDPFVASAYQFGYVKAVHGSFSSTLSAAANAGDQTVDLGAAPSLNDCLVLPSNPPLRVTALSGTTATVYPPVQESVASGTSVTTLNTVDIDPDQSGGLSATTSLVPAVRYLKGYSPTVEDYVAIARPSLSAGAGSDRFVLGVFA